MTETLQRRGTLMGHSGWVTQIATNPKYPDMILSSSRDKTLIVWKLTRDETNYGIPQKRLYGHSHFISDVVLSSDGNYALSGSWDKTLRLWDLAAGKTTRRSRTIQRMFCQLLSAPITVKSCQAHVTRPSSCGTLWPNANTPSKMKVTLTGFHASDSHQITPTQSSFHAVGIVPSRSGIWQTANSRSTTKVTTVTWTPSPFLQTVHCAHPVAKTPKLCSGISMTANICTPWTTTTASMLSASHQTVTGCALPTVHQSKSGIWLARKPSRNFAQKSSHKTQRPIHHNVCHSPGQLMDKPCSLDTVTTLSAYGKCQSQHPVKMLIAAIHRHFRILL